MTDADLVIRPATVADLPEVLRLYAQPELDNGARLPLDAAERQFARMQSYPDYTLFVAEREGRIVGTYALLIMDTLCHLGAPAGVIEDVGVDPAQHGQGIGQAMMRHAIATCRDKGCYKVALSSNLSRQRAHAFYEQLGFERHGYSFRVQFDA
jgi:ribosomal protein S18 acetylase RimI-like enzyme